MHWSFPHFSQVFSTCLRQLSGMPWSLPRLLIPQSLGRDRDSRQPTWEDVCENFEIISKAQPCQFCGKFIFSGSCE